MLVYEYLAKVVNSQLKGGKAGKMPEQLTFNEIVEIALRNHMVYMVFSVLLQEESFSEEQMDFLRTRVKSSVLTALVQSNELNRMSKTFEENCVRNLPLKGAVIKQIYPRPELREMSDIDVLICEEDFKLADDCLIGLGYGNPSSVKHHDIYVKDKCLIIEAHRSLYDRSVDNSQYEYFQGFDKAVLREGLKYTYEFKPEDFYVYMIAHMAKHFYAMGCGIRNLIDIYVFLSKYKSEMDEDYTRAELNRCGIGDFAIHMERLAFDWLEGKELDEFYQSLFQYMQDAGIYGKNENGIWNKFSDERKESISRLELRMWYYFPPVSYMSDYYPWLTKRPWLCPVAWGIRFFRGFFLHKGTKKRQMVSRINKDEIFVYKRIYQKMNLKFSGKI